MLRLTTLVVLAAAIGALALGPVRSPLLAVRDGAQASALNEQGLRHHFELEPEESIESLRAAVALDPRSAAYHFNLSVMYANYPDAAMRATGLSRAEIFAEMIEESRKAKVLEPGDCEMAISHAFNFSFAERFGAEPDWEAAIAAWEDCLELRNQQYLAEPTEANGMQCFLALVRLARTEIEAGSLLTAREHLFRAQTILPSNRLVVKLLPKTQVAPESPVRTVLLLAKLQRSFDIAKSYL